MVYIMRAGSTQAMRGTREISVAKPLNNPTVGKEDYETPVSKGEYQEMLQKMHDNTKDPESREMLAKEIRNNRENGTSNGIKS